MSARFRWIGESVALAIHDEQLAQHGGGSGIRDAGLLASALAKPQQLAAYGEPDVFDLAAAYAFGVALTFPPMNLLMLDRHPQHRGSASSVQAFGSGLIMARTRPARRSSPRPYWLKR